MSSEQAFIVVTAILDATARPAALTLSHGDAMERAVNATATRPIAGLDIVELAIPPKAFAALRDHAGRDTETVALYDVFPLAGHLDPATRRIAGQFLAAEILWALEENGHLKGVPLNLKLDVPSGWDRTPQFVHEKLVEAGALDLAERAIDDFKAIKTAWDAV
ncbi:MAG: hypothetical protein M3Y87_11520 [Myxococcota bacterium]|nr:hypothetical protein [Myxococcota bacterium]